MPRVWSGDRRGSSGKRLKILENIEYYWDQIEKDFAYHLKVDARDWIRGLKPWSQFLNYCDVIANIDGSRFQAAQLNDDRFDAEIERKLNASKGQPYRPPLEGDTAEIKAMRQLCNDMRMFLRTQGISLPLLESPEGPADRIRAKKRAASRARLNEMGIV